MEVRLDDPDTNGVPEPFELTIAPNRFSIVNLHEPDADASEDVPARIPPGVGHTVLVRSLNGVAVTAERVVTLSEPSSQPRGERHPRRPARRPHLVLPRGRHHRRA